MTDNGVADPLRAPTWLGATATVGHLIVGFLALLGTCAGFLWGLSARLATMETKIQATFERNLEQDRNVAALAARMDGSERDRRLLSERLTQVETTTSIEHREISNRLDSMIRDERRR